MSNARRSMCWFGQFEYTNDMHITWRLVNWYCMLLRGRLKISYSISNSILSIQFNTQLNCNWNFHQVCKEINFYFSYFYLAGIFCYVTCYLTSVWPEAISCWRNWCFNSALPRPRWGKIAGDDFISIFNILIPRQCCHYLAGGKFHWIVFQIIQFKINQHFFRKWIGAEKATSHYLNQWWPSSLKFICVIRPRWVNEVDLF